MRAQKRNRRSLQVPRRAVALTLTANKKGALSRALNDVDPAAD